MSKLSEQFKIQKPEEKAAHYELFVEGDWNDADYVSKTSQINKDVFETNDYLLYFLSYISTWCGNRWDSRGKFNETKEWNKFFEDSDIGWDYLPSGYESNIHTVTKVKLEYVEGTTRYPVSIPSWGCLFTGEEDKETKVLEAKTKDENGEYWK